MTRGRTVWLRVHRWTALGVGWLLAAVGTMGAVLVVAQPLDRSLHPQLFLAAASPGTDAPAVPLEAIRQRLTAEFGREVDLVIRPPREATDTLWVMVRGRWSGTVYLDPVTGVERGRRGDDEGFVNVLFRLHSSLLLKDTGKAILAWIALAYLALLSTGLVLWWPLRWPPARTTLRITLTSGLTPGLFSLHRTLGAVFGLMIAVSVASGAYMAWRPLNGFVTWLAGGTAVRPPTLDGDRSPGPAVPLDDLVARALAAVPGAPVGYVQVPAAADRPVRIRLRLPDDPHPNGLTSVWLHPRTGRVLRVDRWTALDPGARAVAVLYPLHTGVLGGPWLEAVVFVNGATLGTLGTTGLWLWWRRRRPRATAGVTPA